MKNEELSSIYQDGTDIQSEMDYIYSTMPLSEIPWNSENPPQELLDLIQSGTVIPCHAIDLGCGAGNYAIHLAKLGFDMTGVDISPVAIELAKKNAVKSGIDCCFFSADLTKDAAVMDKTFDFAYDWDVLHHIFPEFREKYIENVCKLLNAGATYFSVCFHEQDPAFGGKGKYRKTSIGTTLYFSNEEELRFLFEKHFEIISLKTIQIPGKVGSHIANYMLMRAR